MTLFDRATDPFPNAACEALMGHAPQPPAPSPDPAPPSPPPTPQEPPLPGLDHPPPAPIDPQAARRIE